MTPHAADATDGGVELRMLSLKEVIKRTGLSRSTIYKLQSEGKFPQLVKLTERRRAWLEHEIQAHMQIEVILTVFQIIAALNFATHFLAWRSRSFRTYAHDSEGSMSLACLRSVAFLSAGTCT